MTCIETDFATEEYELPAVEAVLAGTLALMTGCAQARCPTQRRQMAATIVANLGLLANHPQLSAQFRCAVGKLRLRWQGLGEDAGESAGHAGWSHPAPARLQ